LFHICRARLDTIGIAGFSHDFGTLKGKRSTIAEIFASFGTVKQTFFLFFIFFVGMVFPPVIRFPSPRKSISVRLSLHATEIAKDLLRRTRKEKEAAVDSQRDQSILGLLSRLDGLIHLKVLTSKLRIIVKASSDDSEQHLSEEEVVSQVNLL
jgi:hypothetical protein